jgi:16S rRNA (cytidine1402-2'-O)-methyltransferase
MLIENDMADKDCIGILYLVATPIGNLEDITFRAVRILKEVDMIAAEDTRHTIKLLNHFEIKKPLVSYHEHNKVEKGEYLIRQLLEGKSIAMVSDAGTPGISDPGEDLVDLAAKNKITVTMIPGPVAAITGLVLSGLPAGKFIFEGFLPVNKKNRKEIINSLKDETRTIVFYEAPHKLVSTLKDLFELLGNRKISIARELTKKFEDITRFTLQEAMGKYESVIPKGEFVLVLEGADIEKVNNESMKKWDKLSLLEHVEMYMEQGMSKKEATKKAADDRGLSKREVYNDLLDKDS